MAATIDSTTAHVPIIKRMCWPTRMSHLMTRARRLYNGVEGWREGTSDFLEPGATDVAPDSGFWRERDYVKDFGISNPLRYDSRVSSRSASLSSTNRSLFPSNTSARPTRYEMFARCGSVDERCPSMMSHASSFGLPARMAST